MQWQSKRKCHILSQISCVQDVHCSGPRGGHGAAQGDGGCGPGEEEDPGRGGHRAQDHQHRGRHRQEDSQGGSNIEYFKVFSISKHLRGPVFAVPFQKSVGC